MLLARLGPGHRLGCHAPRLACPQVKSGVVYEGIFHTIDVQSGSIVLKMAKTLKDPAAEDGAWAPAAKPVPSLVVYATDLVQVIAADVRMGAADVGPVGGDDAGGFGTDAAISRGRGGCVGAGLSAGLGWAPQLRLAVEKSQWKKECVALVAHKGLLPAGQVLGGGARLLARPGLYWPAQPLLLPLAAGKRAASCSGGRPTRPRSWAAWAGWRMGWRARWRLGGTSLR